MCGVSLVGAMGGVCLDGDGGMAHVAFNLDGDPVDGDDDGVAEHVDWFDARDACDVFVFLGGREKSGWMF